MAIPDNVAAAIASQLEAVNRTLIDTLNQHANNTTAQLTTIRTENAAAADALAQRVQADVMSLAHVLEGKMEANKLLEKQAREEMDAKFVRMFDELRADMLALKADRAASHPPSGAAASSWAPGASDPTRRKTGISPSDSVTQTGNTGSPSTLVILGFSVDLAKDDMKEIVGEILGNALPTSVALDSLSIEPYGFGNSCRIKCGSSLVAKQIVDHLRDQDLKWASEEDNIQDKLRVKFEESYPLRKQGGFCFHMYRGLLALADLKKVPLKPLPFVTAKNAGKICLKTGRGFSIIARFKFNDDTKAIDLTYPVARYPAWCSKEEFALLVSTAQEQVCG